MAVGVLVGLIVGKPIGITLATWLVARFTHARIDKDLAWIDVVGLGMLGGIGFTVSLLISELAFSGGNAETNAKIAVLWIDRRRVAGQHRARPAQPRLPANPGGRGHRRRLSYRRSGLSTTEVRRSTESADVRRQRTNEPLISTHTNGMSPIRTMVVRMVGDIARAWAAAASPKATAPTTISTGNG